MNMKAKAYKVPYLSFAECMPVLRHDKHTPNICYSLKMN